MTAIISNPASKTQQNAVLCRKISAVEVVQDELICGAEVEERFRRIRQISRYRYCLFDRGEKLLTGVIARVFDNRNSHVMTSQGTEQIGLRQLKAIDVGTKAFAIQLQCLRNGNLAEERGRN